MKTMTPTEEYEVLAYAFHKMTSLMAPGKSVPMGFENATYEERAEAYRKWYRDNERIILSMVHGFNEIVMDNHE